MNSARRIFRWLMLASCVAQPLLAQPLTNSPVLPGSPAVPTKDASSPAQFTKSPVESFRELLVMPTTEQLKFLMVYPPEIRTRILEKIAEYQSRTPEIELRLYVTELRWYLLPLLSLPATNHAAQLALIPPAMRELVEPRLRQWTVLPPPLRQMLLTNEQAVPFLIQVYNPTSQAPSLTEEQRHRLSENFRRMTELTPNEQDKVLRRLSDAEHRQMDKTLEAFEKLPPDRRARCIRSFAKFAALSAADQRDFLKNAERWSQMSFTERQAWRELVSIAPILPPLPLPAPRRTPYPVGLRASVATNAQ